METLDHMDAGTVKGLQELIRINLDSAEGYDKAASQIDSPVIAASFYEIAEDRRHNAEELQAYVALNERAPAHEGTVKAAAHRVWMTLRKALDADGDQAVLEEVVRGETAIADTYEKVILKTSGNPLADVLHEQMGDIVARRNAMQKLAVAYDEVA